MIPSSVPQQAAVPPIESAAPFASARRVHAALAACCGVLFVFNLIAAPPGAFSPGIHLVEATVLLLPALLIAPASFHQRRAWERRDAILMLPWTLVLAALI